MANSIVKDLKKVINGNITYWKIVSYMDIGQGIFTTILMYYILSVISNYNINIEFIYINYYKILL